MWEVIIIKKFLFILFLVLLIVLASSNVSASDLGKARIGNQVYDTLEDAINAATSDDIINLNSDIVLNDTLEINKTVNINLNGHSITADEKVFIVQGGSLNLTGSGKVIEAKPNYGAIMLVGSDDPSKKDYSTVSIGKDILLEGWSGIFINHLNKTGYGILVNMNGNINAVPDINGGSGAGIYVNGNIKNQENSPIINLSDTVKISSSGNGIYAAGYATYNINGAYISGKEAGLGIKSGVFNILDGTIVGSGENKIPTGGNNNGINASGAAIQIESNPSYTGNIEIDIKNGLIKSNNSNVIYEYTVNNTQTKVETLSISGGEFISDSENNVFKLSESLMQKPAFISGGVYSSNPEKNVKAGYTVATNQSGLYEVVKNTVSVFSETNNNKVTYSITIIFILIISGIILYLNGSKIIRLFGKK